MSEEYTWKIGTTVIHTHPCEMVTLGMCAIHGAPGPGDIFESLGFAPCHVFMILYGLKIFLELPDPRSLFGVMSELSMLGLWMGDVDPQMPGAPIQ